MRVLVAGASGFLGTRLRERLDADGHEVVQLVRREPGAPNERRWDPSSRQVDVEDVRGADAVVNLGGSPLIGNPHSKKYRRELRQSRVDTTTTLAEAIASVAGADGDAAAPTFVAANGIAYYGDHGDQVVTETTESRGDALLTSVTRDWQRATQPADRAGARVVVLRTPPVIDRRSGALKAMLPIFKTGLGGPLGSGQQYFPIVSTHDWVRVVVEALTNEDLAGPVNPVIPEPTTNAEFTATLADLLNRPAFLKVPAFVIDKAAGPLSPELLGSVRAVPRALLDTGFTFAHPEVESVLRAALNAGR
ncbi:TIGR01777 family oxidoreductase [Nocardioidaceae bacterium]|nr:TIGR01777 family oxidoreductase [Nocardioidaceae bacterium]